ncbi:hypothetical protein WA026_009298 [Henosepilachna vigintioctopunctata]|uniref:Uncharacterized protein n=1 Tax=Henosepilachna vigintioctopunctata TaxID=420089 RepID=A0AAW1UZS5_9CUCU
MDYLTHEGHVFGMLDRDQRTARPSVVGNYRDRQTTASSFTSTCGCECRKSSPASCNVTDPNLRTDSISHADLVRGRTSPSTVSRVRKNENRTFWVGRIPGLHRTLILGFYLTIVTLPTTLAAPSTRRPGTMTSNGVEKWMKPCGRKIDRLPGDTTNEVRATDAEMLEQIIDQTNRSYRKVNDFKDKFAKKAFKIDWEQLHSLHKSYSSYDWLPGTDKIPKTLGEHTDPNHLESLELDATLYNTYEYLQRIAVGIDQIVIDETRSGSSFFKSDFEEIETYVLSILCEIETTMVERKLEKRPDIQRHIVPDNLKNGDNTNMNVRNYIILRDYMNILEYVSESFEYLKSKL